MAGVEIRHLSKRFGQLHAVDDVDLSIRESEFLVLLGPSGCGKTTLLRMIAGLEQPTAGEIHIGGVRMDDAPPRARGIAMVFQSYALYPHRTVSRNISFPSKRSGCHARRSTRRCAGRRRCSASEPTSTGIPDSSPAENASASRC